MSGGGGDIPVAGSWEVESGLRREVRPSQKEIKSGLGNIVTLDWGPIRPTGLAPKMAGMCKSMNRVARLGRAQGLGAKMFTPQTQHPPGRPTALGTGWLQGTQAWLRVLGVCRRGRWKKHMVTITTQAPETVGHPREEGGQRGPFVGGDA